MRKLIESTLVSLDGVIETPERWATFDAEDTAYSIEQLGNNDAFIMGRVTYEKFYANWGRIADPDEQGDSCWRDGFTWSDVPLT
jgi:dihydrofolate reductase